MMESDTDSEGEELGMIRPALIRELRNVLDEYPDDGQIFKELIQNAEDAGATTVKILRDARHFNQQLDPKVLRKHPHLKFFQGPALCVYNDAKFTDRDWKGIRMLHTSVKEKDPLKVGRFGLGFKSVFHMTDRLMILSGSSMMYMDPFKGEDRYCKMTRVAGKKERELESLLKILEGVFGVSSETFSADSRGFPGTLFWFPLRQTGSELSSTVYSQEKVENLLDAFKAEAPSLLLFLNNIQRVSIYARDDTCGPDELFSVGLASACLAQVREERGKFVAAIREGGQGLPAEALSCVTEVVMETVDHLPGHKALGTEESARSTAAGNSSPRSDPAEANSHDTAAEVAPEAVKHEHGLRNTRRWLVVSYHAGQGDISEELKQLCADPELSYRPYVGMAVPMTDHDNFQSQVFCFLPLPLDTRSPTGLPVHVHGYFALSQNRRHLKWPTADQLSHRKKLDPPLRWNCLLVHELLPRAYEILLNRLKNTDRPNPKEFYAAWPDVNSVDDRWRSLLRPLYTVLATQPSFYSHTQGGQWVFLRDAVLERFSQDMVDEVKAAVTKVYSASQQSLVRLPDHVHNTLLHLELLQFTETISAGRVSQLLSSSLPDLSRRDKMHVLLFLCGHDNGSDLVRNQELVPLADGTFAVFEGREQGSTVIHWCQDRLLQLFPGLESEFCDNRQSAVKDCLYELARSGKFALQVLEENDARVSQLMEKSLQARFGNQQPLLSQGDTWIQQVWNFLAFTEPWCKNLKAFSHLTLLPAWREEGIVLLPLSDVYACRFARGIRTNPLSVELISCLTKLGVVVLPELPDYVARHTEVLGRWVHYPSTEGLLDALKRINDDVGRRQRAVDNFNSSASAEEKDTVIAFLETSEDRHDPLEMFHQIKLFTEVTTNDTVSIDDVTTIAPDILPPLTLHRRLLSCSSLHRRVAIWLGAGEATLEEIVSEAMQLMKPGYSQFSSTEIITFMKFVLGNEELTASVALMDLIRRLEFVPTTSGQLKLAEDLYDPTSSVLQKLFFAEDKFPCSPFLEPAILKTLKVLGLRGEDSLNLSDVTATSELIQELFDQQKQSAEVKAEGLWETLIQHSQQFDSDTLRRISAVRCLPCVLDENRPDHYPKSLPYSRSSRLAKPQEMCLASQASLAGSILPVIGESMPSLVAKKLQVGSRVDVKRVLQHLDNILIHYQSTEAAKYRLILNNVFQFLQRHMTESAVVQTLKEKQCVPSDSDDHLVRPGAFWTKKSEDDIQLKPYRFLLPNDLQNEKDLFKACGSAQNQDAGLLRDVLLEIQDFHSNQPCSPSEFKRDFQLVKQILDVLNQNETATDGTVLLPVCHSDPSVLHFQQAKDCTVVSTDGLMSVDLFDDDTEIFMVHPEIHHDTAVALGALKMKDRALTGIDFGYKQRGELTSQLQNLLKDSYTDGFSVPKELIQNADDAGATEVCFLLDERENEDARQNLITDGMASFQGPAFWAYNDATFSDSDFENIVKLGADTKKEDTSKVGRFGFGFNSVYNLTDVPSFISRHTMAMFDPHVKHLKGGAGLKLDFRHPVNRALLSRMPQQFKPFQGVFGCRLQNDGEVHYDGTLFRFPLRTPQQAADSRIKNESYSESKRREFLKMLLERAGGLLMFTQSVRKVKVFHLPRDCTDPSSPQCLLDLTKTSHSRVLQSERGLLDQTILKYFTSKWPDNTDIRIVEDVTIAMKVKREAQSVCDSEAHTSNTEWRLAWASGVDQSADLARLNPQEGLVPIAAVATLMKDGGLRALKDSPPGFYKSGHLYCFLPLPDSSDCGSLPVHVNATFALTSSRRSLLARTEDDLNSEGAAWNSALIADAVSRAYLLLLENVQNEAAMDTDFRRFFDLWPVSGGPDLVEGFWKRLVANGNKILPVPGDSVFWVAFTEAWFLSGEFRDSDCGNIAWKALQHFWNKEGHLVDVSADIYAAIAASKQADVFQAKVISAEEFYRDSVFPNIDSSFWEKQHRDKLVHHALLQRKSELDTMLAGCPCIPCADSQRLKQPTELIHPKEAAAKLYLPSDGHFPQGGETAGDQSNVNFCSAEILQRLVELGMITVDLPWEMVLERAASVADLVWRGGDTAHLRTRHIVEYLSTYRNMSVRIKSCPPDVKVELSQTQFLPVRKKPADWSFPWASEEAQDSVQLAAPRDLYSDSVMDLVGCHKLVVDNESLGVSALTRVKADVLETLGVQGKKNPSNETLLEISKLQLQTIAQAKKEDPNISNALTQRLCLSVYEYMTKCLDRTSSGARNNIFKELCDSDVFWTGTCFVDPSRVAIQLRFDCRPYRFQVETSFQKFKLFFKAIGVKDTLSAANLASLLEEIRQEFAGKELRGKMIDLVSGVGQLLCESLHESSIEDELEGCTVFLPDRHGFMQPVYHLCVDDCEWLKETDTMRFVSDKVPRETAVVLGVKSKRRTDFESLSEAIPFGQSEALTDRIRRLLEGYTFDSSLFKELLQNADDAGASEIRFIKDPRRLETNRVFEGCEDLQGPALCVFNDKSFTKGDMEGIQNLGRGSKWQDSLKTGQYGVGFNAVYHITDVPSFWTLEDDMEEVICILDPNCKYVPTTAPNKPGMKLKNIDRIRESYPDMFAGYLGSAIDMTKSGTLFRFPLRTRNMAKTSEIKKEAVTISHIDGLLKEFEKEMSTCLLFLNNLRKIGIYSVRDDGSVELESEVNVDTDQRSIDSIETFKRNVYQASKSIQDETVSLTDIAAFEACSLMTVHNSNGLKEEWLSVHRVGFQDSSRVSSELHSEWHKETFRLLPRGGVAVKLAETSKGKGLHIPKPPRHQAFCILPLPVFTNLPMHVNGHFALDHETRRGLWDNRVDDKPDVKTEWNEAIAAAVIVPAYITALRQIRDVWFSSAETLGKGDLRARLEYYHSLFPDLDLETAPTQFWTNMRKELYKEIANQEVPLFPVLSLVQTGSLEWVPAVSSAGFAGHFSNLQKVFCDAPDKPQTSRRRVQQSSETRDNTEWAQQKAKRLKSVLKRLNMKVLEAPYSIFENFKKSGENGVVDISPETVVRFLKSAGSETPGRCNINDLPQSVASTPLKTPGNVHTLLNFVGYEPFLLENLQGLPLCLRQSGNLYFFHQTEGNDKPIVSRFFRLLTGSEDLFIHNEIMDHLLPVSDTVRAWVRELDIPTLCRLLPQTLSPEIFRTGYPCRLEDNPLPSEVWLKTLWKFVDSRMDTRGILDPEKDRRAAEAKLQDLMGWSLLPVKQSTGNVTTLLLYPVKDRHTVVFLNEKPDQSNHSLWRTLRTLSLPYLNTNFLPDTSVTITIMASIGHPVALLKALFACASSLKPQVEQAKTILSYLNDNLSGIIQSFGDKAELQKMLKRLPLYPEIDGKLTEVFPNMDVLCLSDIPSKGLVQWATNRRHKLVLLKKYGLPEFLCTFLEFGNPRSPQFYHEYLLPTMDDLPRSAILDHMTAIKSGLEGTSKWLQYDKDNVVERLQVTEFIEVDDELYTANTFYSPHHPVFRVMCLPCDTPPSPFCYSQWEWFMKKAGMISEVTQDMFIRFAHALEGEGKSTQISSTAMKSDTLVMHLFHRSDLTSTFLSQLKDIRFVRPSEWAKTEEGEILCKIAKPFCTDRLVSFSESCREENLLLTWSSGCILRPNADPSSYQRISEDTRRFIVNHLCIHYSVARNKVIEHVQNVCETLSGHSSKELFKPADSSDLVKKVMMKVYRYLHNNVEDEDIVVLKRLAIICDIENQQMLKPVNVVVDLRKEEAVRGHIVKAPALFGEFFSLFKRLGAAERVTADHYATVLSRLEEKAGENVLHVEEMKLYVQTSVRELFKCLRSDSEETKRLTVDHVYLPSDTECLTRSTQLVFIDDIPLRKRFQEMPQDLHVFIGFKKLEIYDVIPQNELKLLPEKHQVQFLSHILTEAVSEDVKRRAAEGQYSRAIDRKIKSPELGDAVVRLAFDHHSKHGKAGTSFTKATADQILQSLSSIVIKEIEGLKTVLVWKRDGVQLDGTECDQKSFVDKSLCGDRSCTVYLDRRTCDSEGIKILSITKSLTNAVIHSIGVGVNSDYLLLALQNAREALVQMDEEGIQPLDFSTEVDKTVFPPPGTFIPLHLHCYLDNSFESFYNGEHAGFELYDPQMDERETEENVPVYIYAIVIEEVEQEGEVPLLARRYRIDLGPERGETEASVTQLYKFIRKPNQGTPRAVVIYEGRTAPEGATSAAAETSAPLDFKAVMKEIRRILTEAWQALGEKDRNRVVKRLYLKWHPDKNRGNETFCTRVVQLLQHYIKLLEQGRPLPDDENEDKHSSSDSSFHPHWDSFFEHMNRRSRAHRDSFNSPSGRSRSGSSYRRRFREEDYRRFHYNSYTNASSANPQPGEARRWFRQAQADLDAARAARASSFRGHNWVCFQCHQAMEKALMAVLYYRDAKSSCINENSLVIIACAVGDDTLRNLARQLEERVGDHRQMRYPSLLMYPRIPADMYDADDARLACDLAARAVDRVETILG